MSDNLRGDFTHTVRYLTVHAGHRLTTPNCTFYQNQANMITTKS